VTSGSGLQTYMFLMGAVMVASGLYGIFRPAGIAQRNRAHVDSGEEAFFEERRAWEHYGRPPTSAGAVRRACWLAAAAGAALLCIAALGGGR
jgi:hypothetical protein